MSVEELGLVPQEAENPNQQAAAELAAEVKTEEDVVGLTKSENLSGVALGNSPEAIAMQQLQAERRNAANQAVVEAKELVEKPDTDLPLAA